MTNAPARPPLRRVRGQAVAGVSAGLAEHLGIPVGLVRAIFVVLTGMWGTGVLLYAWFWALVPLTDDGAESVRVTRRWPVAWILIGVSALATVLAVANTWVGAVPAAWVMFTLLAQALAVAAALWAGLLDRDDIDRGPRHAALVRAVATGLVVLLLIVTVIASQRMAHSLASLLLVATGVLALGGIYAPTLITRFRELSADRVARIREEQRSEMAAHLHDSVLQTLALIQNRAEPSSEVARIARAQERELRSWLYDGDEAADSDLPTDLRDYAAALELDYPVHIDVVAAGTATERASGDIAAAAREAMLNAARHAGGDVSVYIESRPSTVEVFIRDRGPGFALEAVPDDRLGVRQSIIGRMRRAGGSATVVPGAGGVGTEVRLKLDRPEPRAQTAPAAAQNGEPS